MDPITGAALIGAGSSAAGMAASGIGGRVARGWQRRENERAREWSERMSGSQIQRGMRDAKKAGLNPILMASGGMSAGPASAGMASASRGSIDGSSAVSAGAAAASAGMAIRNQKKTGKILDNQIRGSWHASMSEGHKDRIGRVEARKALDLAKFYNSAAGTNLVINNEYLKTYVPAASAAARMLPGMGVLKTLKGLTK